MIYARWMRGGCEVEKGDKRRSARLIGGALTVGGPARIQDGCTLHAAMAADQMHDSRS